MMEKKEQRWLVLHDDDWTHVIPEWDTKPHGLDKDETGELVLGESGCPCIPKVEMIGKMIIHKSFYDEERIDESLKRDNQ